MMMSPGTVDQLDGSTEVTEAGSTDTFTVVLDAQPTSDVVVSMALTTLVKAQLLEP